MKKFLTSLSAGIGSVLFATNHALAFIPVPTIAGLEATDDGSSESVKVIIVRGIKYVLDLVLILGVVFVIVAGVRLIFSGGDEGSKDKAKQTIIYVIVGIIVIVMARVIVNFADQFFRS